MNFKSIINNLVNLFDAQILDAQGFKNGVQKAIDKHHFIPVHFKHIIGNYQFTVKETFDGVIVEAYENYKHVFTRVISDSDNEVRIYNYCNKFASDCIYRKRRMAGLKFSS